MKKIISASILGLLASAPAVPALALDITGKLTNVGTAAGFAQTEPSIAATAGGIIQGLLSLLGIVFMAYILYAGYLWMTARGKEESLEKARAIIRGSIIGIIIVLSAYAITAFVLDRVISATGYTGGQG